MIEIWRYKLRPSATLNATVSTGASICEGALVRMDGGYGCIHPWPTLGDASLDQQLLMLKQGEPSELARRALDCCIADGEARKEGRSLFEGLEQPRNHATIAAGETAASLVRRAPKFHSDGFAIVKIKSGPDVEFEAARVNAFAGEWLRLQPENRIRLDFNGSLDSLRLRQFVSMLRPRPPNPHLGPGPPAPLAWPRQAPWMEDEGPWVHGTCPMSCAPGSLYGGTVGRVYPY